MFQIGEAPVMPEATALIGVLSLFPTHAETSRVFVYPKVQLSRRLFVVPVLTATCCLGILSTELKPNAAARALLSDKMSVI